MAALPSALKPLKRFLVQANQVEKVNPKAAYYARLYALMGAMKLPKEDRTTEVSKLIAGLMDTLEKAKSTIELDNEADRSEVEAFAMTVFGHADRTDRAGKADKGTMFGYVTASVILDVLHYFEADLETEITDRIKYAQWRAAEISKAIKEGRQPTPVNPIETNDDELNDEDELKASFGDEAAPFKARQSFDEDDSKPGPAAPAATPASAPAAYSSGEDEPVLKKSTHPKDEYNSSPKAPPAYQSFGGSKPAAASAPAPAPAPVRASAPTPVSDASTFALMNEAEKRTKEAMAALRFNDYDAAAVRLETALRNVKLLQQRTAKR